MNHIKSLKDNEIKKAYFILKDGKTVEVPYQGDFLNAAEACIKLYGEVGYLDSVSNS